MQWLNNLYILGLLEENVVLKKLLKRYNKSLLKAELRKLGTNLITAGIIAVFLSHGIVFNMLAMFSIFWVACVGLGALFLGSHDK